MKEYDKSKNYWDNRLSCLRGDFLIMDEIPSDHLAVFDFRDTKIIKCPCGEEYKFYCQEDKCPEYYTCITLECKCKKLLWIQFPVN